MAKIVVVSANGAHRKLVADLIARSAAHVVIQQDAQPRQVLAQGADLPGADLLILDGQDFTSDELGLLRRCLTEKPEMLCMLLATDPSTDLLMGAMRAGVQCVLPWPPAEHEFRDELQRCTRHATGAARNDGQMLSFVSCKGGSGTTFAASNLASVLAHKHGKHVLLLDLNQQYGDAAFLVTDQVPSATLSDVCRQIDRLDPALLDACVTHVNKTFDVLAGAGDPIKVGEIKASQLERIIDVALPLYDVVMVDVGQDINPITIQVLDRSHLIFPVLQQSLSHLRAGRRMLDIFSSLGYRTELMRLIVNQFDKKAQVTQRTLEENLGMPVSYILPNDPATAREAASQGVPVVQLAENSAISRALQKMADQLYPESVPRSEGLLGKLLGHGGRAYPATLRMERQA
ncbi:MAG: AAA family ATPase [Cupriavidus sp.]|nr:AAA family ATPase [Cupriavidus sp.]